MRVAHVGAPIACFLGLSILTSAGAIAESYKAALLHPAGFDYTANGDISISGATQVGWGYGPATEGEDHALLWYGTAESVVDLHPVGFDASYTGSVSGVSQVGLGSGTATGGEEHALLWNGTAESVVDLHPAGFDYSTASGVSGASQVGRGVNRSTIPFGHALLWNGTAESVVDLNPEGFVSSSAAGVWGGSQVGHGSGPATGTVVHALLWNGTPESVVDLHPAGLISDLLSSGAGAVSGAYQAGTGIVGDGSGPTLGGYQHALMWNSTAESVVDLHPLGFEDTVATSVSGAGSVVGYGSGPATEGEEHALLWNGTAESVFDLHSYLTDLVPGLRGSSASGIADNGTIVGRAYDSSTSYAVLWTPVPEPSTVVMLGLGATLLTAVRRLSN